MTPVMLFGELRDGYAFFVLLNRVPQSVQASVRAPIPIGLEAYAGRPMTWVWGRWEVG